MARDTPYTEVKIDDVVELVIEAVPSQRVFIDEMRDSLHYFFSRMSGTYSDHYADRGAVNFPFKGFVLAGPPGTGKTEAVRIAFRELYDKLANENDDWNLRLLHINPADVNRSGVGDIERNIRRIFKDARGDGENGRTILLFDDIETLIVGRKDAHTTEWSRAANGVFFHELDRLSSDNTLVVATTNEPDLIDSAIHSRLSLRYVPAPSLDEMLKVARSCLPMSQPTGLPPLDEMMSRVRSNIEESEEDPSFRLARKAAIEVMISEVVGWR